MNSIEPSLPTVVTKALNVYKRAVYGQDVDAFMQLYDANVRVFDTCGMWSYEGAAGWRNMIESGLGTLGDERVKVTFDDVRTTSGNDLLAVNAIVTYAGHDASGRAQKAMQNRLSWVLKRAGNDWKVIHEHASAPVGFDHGNVILNRDVSA